MNASEIAQLSYKELQALALRYRVPGNIKKKVLVKVLQAARSGNEAEFSRLLQELRKNRKRKTRKSKDPKLGLTSTPLHSPDYMMADEDYYCQQQQQQQSQQQQQQPPYQWVGAEEEIVSKDDNEIPHYDEFKQFLLKRIQREFQACDTNNNQIQDLSIVDLRTAAGISSNVQTISLDVPSYSKTSLIGDAESLAISNVDRPSYQVLKETESNSQGPFLLKRMLQAPVGANLGEIASSLFWASNLLDNSDTLTAESENNENEDQLETTVNANEYYSLLKNAKGEFLLNEANLRNVETFVPQAPEVVANEDQYRYPNDLGNRHNYQNWTVTSMMEVPESDLQSSKVFHTIYYNNTDAVAAHTADNNLPYQYQTNNETCNGSQNFFNFDTGYTTGTDIITANDSADIYYLQNASRNTGEDIGTGYFRNVEPLAPNCAQHSQQAFPNGARSTSDSTYQYLYPRLTQETDHTLRERLEHQQVDSNVVVGIECGVNQATDTASVQVSANGTVEPFWPRWSAQVGNNLENILNYHVSKQVDYAKLGQTSCVYCYVAPIVSQRSSLINNTCSQTRRYTAEQRQHSFSAYWMLYNDTSQGMRMTNMSSKQPEQLVATLATMHANTISSDDMKETVSDIVSPINDVWMNQYEPVSIAEDINVQVSDSLFCNVTAVRIDDIPTPDIAKT